MQHHDQVRIARDRSALSRRNFLRWSGSAALLASGTVLTQAGRAHPAGSGRQIRMGVVEGGFGAAFWWHKHPQCVVTGVTDLRPNRREILRQRYHCDRVYDSLETMVKEADDIDAVAIFSGGSGPRPACQDVLRPRLAHRVGRSHLHDARRGGDAEGTQGADRTEIHVGRDQLLSPGTGNTPRK